MTRPEWRGGRNRGTEPGDGTGDGKRGSARAMRHHLLNGLLLAVSLATVFFVLFLPYYSQGYPPGHSGDFNVSLTANFLNQLYAGQVYPRWLTDVAYGVGAPVFYFYAPAPFYLAVVAHGLCPGCDVQTILSVTHGLLYFLSGVAFFLWARSFVPAVPGLLGALWYVVLPYHFIDLEYRNAIGEGMGYLFMPLVLLGVSNLAGPARWLCLAAVSYAALIVTHLPTALLFTPVMAFFALAQADRASWRRRLAKLVAAGLLGVALAGIYLVPALLLRQTLVPDAWVSGSGEGYHPEAWLFLSGKDSPFGDWGFQANVARSIGFVSILALLSIASLVTLRRLSGRREPPFGRRRGRTVAAAAACIALAWVMMTPPSEWLWVNVDLLRQVQFPWRLGAIVDLCGATIVTISLSRLAVFAPALRGLPGGAWARGLQALLVLATAMGLASADTPRSLLDDPPPNADAPAVSHLATPIELSALSEHVSGWAAPVEYRGKWIVNSEVYGGPIEGGTVLERHEEAYERWRRHIAGLPPVSAAGGAGRAVEHAFARTGASAFDISLSLRAPRSLLIRVAYFPHWTLRERGGGRELPISPDPETGLIRVSLPAGEHRLRLGTRMLVEERIGALASAAGLLVLLVMLARDRAGGRRARARAGPGAGK